MREIKRRGYSGGMWSVDAGRGVHLFLGEPTPPTGNFYTHIHGSAGSYRQRTFSTPLHDGTPPTRIPLPDCALPISAVPYFDASVLSRTRHIPPALVRIDSDTHHGT
jgi:hypothetical protein